MVVGVAVVKAVVGGVVMVVVVCGGDVLEEVLSALVAVEAVVVEVGLLDVVEESCDEGMAGGVVVVENVLWEPGIRTQTIRDGFVQVSV